MPRKRKRDAVPLDHHSDDWSITPENECESLLDYHVIPDGCYDNITEDEIKRERQVDLEHVLIGLPWWLSW